MTLDLKEMTLDLKALIISGFTLIGFMSCVILKLQGRGLWNTINLYFFILIMWFILYNSLKSKNGGDKR